MNQTGEGVTSSMRRSPWEICYRGVQELRVIDISDPYVAWLRLANAGMVHRGNLYCIDYAIRHLPSSAPILEIGSFCGLSTNLITYYKERHQAKNRVIACDKWVFEGAEEGQVGGHPSLHHDEFRALVRESYLRNVRLFSAQDLPYTVEMTSDEFFEAWRARLRATELFGRELSLGGPLSFCYIDGNHTYEFVRRDVEQCDRHLEPGGFLFLDDSGRGSPFPGVHRVVQETRKTGRYAVIAQNPHVLLQKKR